MGRKVDFAAVFADIIRGALLEEAYIYTTEMREIQKKEYKRLIIHTQLAELMAGHQENRKLSNIKPDITY